LKSFSFCRVPRQPQSPLFPYTTLFRSIRPLFPEGFRNDVQIVAIVMSVDQDCPSDIAAMIGTSAALSISDVPFSGPIGGVIVGRDRKSTRLNSSHVKISYAVFCLKKNI